MSPGRAYVPEDLLAMPPPALQRALLKVPDDLLAQALAGATEEICTRLTANLSARRAADIRVLSRRLVDSGELKPPAARTALRNMVRKVFEISGLEASATEASRSAGAIRATAGHGQNLPTQAADKPASRDLTPADAKRLREARAVLDVARKVSPFVKSFENAKRGANAAVLVRTWLGRRG